MPTNCNAQAAPALVLQGANVDEPSPARTARGGEAGTRQPTIANVFPGPNHRLPEQLVTVVRRLEGELSAPVCLMIQGTSSGMYGAVTDPVAQGLIAAERDFPEKTPAVLVLDSLGGFARDAYQIASFLRKRCGGFSVLVPRKAKSAATLLALGADRIQLGRYGELGPLDAQFEDVDRERFGSVLDEVVSLQQLHTFALEALDWTMILLGQRSRKRIETLLPHATQFIAQMMRPVLEKIDAVHWSEMARALKVAEEYARRLLQRRYPENAAHIARALVTAYPEHGFVIDRDEATALGLQVEVISPEIEGILEELLRILQSAGLATVIGRLVDVPEISSDAPNSEESGTPV